MRRAALLTASLFVAACSGGGSSPGTLPTAAPTATPTAAPTGSGTESAFTCPTSDSAASVARTTFAGEAVHRMARGRHAAAYQAAANALAVTYSESTARSAGTALAARELRSGATFVREFDHPSTHRVTRIVTVPASSLAATAAALRGNPGVLDVARTGYRRRALSVTAPYLPNDPYFKGFAPTTTAPLYESASNPGEWDKHVERLEYAFGYSQSGNGSTVQNAKALGSASVKIAIIDSGEDPTHPELASKIAYQKCFITDTNNVQSTSNFETDPQGHGTDVAGIAAAASGNDLGFTGSGGNASLYAYRVFPTPDDNCTSDSTTDAQCAADTEDIASAIEDAVSQHVNVISISLGGDTCTNGVDPDPTEGAAIEDAINAGIIVVAAAGNDGTSPVGAPACDTGVIAAGATGLEDGSPNGAGNSNGSASSPKEYVASYSDFGSPGANVNSANAWGIVAPGGDPSDDNDNDDLHWIENIWTSTPFDTNFAGSCTPDFEALSTTDDCRTLIAGTSMAAPNVAGTAALILAVNSSYQSASAMKTLLCQTADDIGDPNEGCGRLDAYRAMARALGDPSPPGAQPVP